MPAFALAIGGGIKSVFKFLIETRVGNFILIGIAVLLFLWWYGDKKYDEGVAYMVEQNELARQAWEEAIDEHEEGVRAEIADIGAQLSSEIADIETINTTIWRPTIEREIAANPALSDGTCEASAETVDALNDWPLPEGCTIEDGSISCNIAR